MPQLRSSADEAAASGMAGDWVPTAQLFSLRKESIAPGFLAALGFDGGAAAVAAAAATLPVCAASCAAMLSGRAHVLDRRRALGRRSCPWLWISPHS